MTKLETLTLSRLCLQRVLHRNTGRSPDYACCKIGSNKGRSSVCFPPRDAEPAAALRLPRRCVPQRGGRSPAQSPPVLSGSGSRCRPWPTVSGKARRQGRKSREGRQETDGPERAVRAVPAAAKTLEREQVNRGSRRGTARRRETRQEAAEAAGPTSLL
ncbi:uncharacterized protein LOC113458841 [Zonotrichia albicollis]|uniref:uncharacterized protein LOC113458841 n=1 Tax=Zonotrichia albicollis TaxID=44394 RepID=UPI003D80BCD1